MFSLLNGASGLLMVGLVLAGWMDAIPLEALGPSAAVVIVCLAFLWFLKGQREADRASQADRLAVEKELRDAETVAAQLERAERAEEREKRDKWLEQVAMGCHGAHATTIDGLKESQDRSTDATNKMNETGSHLREQIRETSRDAEKGRSVLHRLDTTVAAASKQSSEDSQAMREMIARLSSEGA